MSLKKEVPLKEKYRLWWEYLQRHDEFQEWLFWERRRWQELKKGILHDKAFQEYLTNLPDKLKGETNRRYYSYWSKGKDWEVGPLFKEIWARGCSFEKWWIRFEKQSSKVLAVEDYINGPLKRSGRSRFQFQLALAMALAKQKVKKRMSVNDFGELFNEEFLKIVKGESSSYFPIVVNLSANKTNRDIAEEFLCVLRRRRKQLGLEKDAIFYKRGRYPLEPFHKEDLERYLRVYDLRQKEGKTYPEIEEIIRKEFGSKASYHRTLPEDFKIAKQIIRNAAKGLFPKYHR